MKICSRCKKEKNLSEFAKAAANPDGLQYWCRACMTEHRREWAQNNPEKIKAARERRDKIHVRNTWRYWSVRRRGVLISREEFDNALLVTVCAICTKEIHVGTMDHNIDHDHKTGQFRGVLCRGCNTTLGHFGESLERIQAVIAYLEGAQERYDPNAEPLPPMPGRTGRKKVTDDI